MSSDNSFDENYLDDPFDIAYEWDTQYIPNSPYPEFPFEIQDILAQVQEQDAENSKEDQIKQFVSNVMDCIEKEQTHDAEKEEKDQELDMKALRKYFMSLRRKVKGIDTSSNDHDFIVHQVRVLVNETVMKIIEDGWEFEQDGIIALCTSLFEAGLLAATQKRGKRNSKPFLTNRLASNLFSLKYKQ